jgi:hypothetical protein
MYLKAIRGKSLWGKWMEIREMGVEELFLVFGIER